MNFILIITAIVTQQAALHSCRTLGVAPLGATPAGSNSGESSRGVEPRSLAEEEYLPEVSVHLKRSPENQHGSPKDYKHAKIPHEEKIVKNRRMLKKLSKKQLIELLPLRHKGKGKTVAYILAPDGDKRAFKGLIDGRYEIDDKDMSRSEDSSDSEGSDEEIYNILDKPAAKHEGSHDAKHVSEVVDQFKHNSGESNSHQEASDSAPEDVSNANGEESNDNSHDLSDSDSDEKSQSQVHHLNLDHNVHDKHLEESSDVSDSEDDSKSNFEENPISHLDHSDNSASYDKSTSDEESASAENVNGVENENDSSQDYSEPDTSQDTSEIKKDIINSHKNLKERFEEGSFDSHSAEVLVGNENSKEISDTKVNVLDIIESYEETGDHKPDCRLQGHIHRGRSRQKGNRHPRHRTYNLKFHFNR